MLWSYLFTFLPLWPNSQSCDGKDLTSWYCSVCVTGGGWGGNSQNLNTPFLFRLNPLLSERRWEARPHLPQEQAREPVDPPWSHDHMTWPHPIRNLYPRIKSWREESKEVHSELFHALNIMVAVSAGWQGDLISRLPLGWPLGCVLCSLAPLALPVAQVLLSGFPPLWEVTGILLIHAFYSSVYSSQLLGGNQELGLKNLVLSIPYPQNLAEGLDSNRWCVLRNEWRKEEGRKEGLEGGREDSYSLSFSTFDYFSDELGRSQRKGGEIRDLYMYMSMGGVEFVCFVVVDLCLFLFLFLEFSLLFTGCIWESLGSMRK